MEVLDPGDDDPRWRRIATPNNEHYGYTDAYEAKGAGASVATEGSNFYIVGGDEDWKSKGSASIEKFDVEQGKWTYVTNMSFARRETGVAVLDGKIYVTGGFDETGKKRLNDVECYDISEKTWTTLASMNKERSGHTLLAINGSLIAVGGNLSSIEEYDVANNTWNVKEDYLDPRPRGAFIMMKYYLQPE